MACQRFLLMVCLLYANIWIPSTVWAFTPLTRPTILSDGRITQSRNLKETGQQQRLINLEPSPSSHEQHGEISSSHAHMHAHSHVHKPHQHARAVKAIVTIPSLPLAVNSTLPLTGLVIYSGKLSVVPMDDQSDTVNILLRQAGGQQLWLDFGVTLTAAPQGFKRNQMVNVTGTIEPGTKTLVVTGMIASAIATTAQRIWSGAGATAAPTTLRTLYAQVTFCGITPAFSLETWKTKIGGPTAVGYNLQTLFNQSSYGKTQLTSIDMVGPLNLGSPACCIRVGGCNPNDFNLQTIWNFATSTGLNLATYGHTAIAWPPMVSVAWAGLGLVHDYGDYTCWVYFNGNAALDVHVLAHEIGHNIGLNHASYLDSSGNNVEYGDSSSPMGSGTVAFSPANDYQMGWSSPVQLTGRNLPLGATVTITTPAVTHSSKSGIRIVPDWAPLAPVMFLGFRVRESGDIGLSDQYAGKTTVNTWQGTGYSDTQKTWWLASVDTAQSYYNSLSGLTTRQLQLTADGTSAVVSICRNSSTVETAATCNNGLDDDCDGFIDAADPDCGALYPPPNPSPPPATSPPQTAGYDWTSLPASNYPPDNYKVFMCPVGGFVTSLTLYASSYFYGSGPMNYIGGFDIRCNDGSLKSFLLPSTTFYPIQSQSRGFTNISGATGYWGIYDGGLMMNIFGFGSNLTNSNPFNYAPPTPGALLSGVAVSSCPWPPYEGGRFGKVPCNMQFAFSAAISTPLTTPPVQSRSNTPSDSSPPPPSPLYLPPSPPPRPPPSPPPRPPPRPPPSPPPRPPPRPPPSPPRPPPPRPPLRPSPPKRIVTLTKRKSALSRIANKRVYRKRKITVLRG